MWHTRAFSPRAAVLTLLILAFAGGSLPVSAMEVIVFTSERSLIVNSCEESGNLMILNLPGGGVLGVPKDRIKHRFPGFMLPQDEAEPENLLPGHLQFRDIIAKYCQMYEMDWKIVAAVIQVESAFNREAVSPKGAQGLMQLMPSVQKEEGVSDPFDPDQNIRAGVHYLKRMFEACEGDLELALAAYNAGLSRVQRAEGIPNIAETKNYVAKILEIYPTL